MIDAWLSSSERITVRSSASVGIAASFAFQQETYVSAASVADELREVALELEVRLEGPADEAHGRGAGAVALEPLDAGPDDVRVVGEPEVVVR